MGGEWKRVTVAEVCELIVDCVNKTAPIVEELTPYKMLRTTNIKGGRIDREECRRVSKDTFVKWTRRADVRRGDVILTREAPMGEVGYVNFDDSVFLGQRLMQYRANLALLEPRFLFYSFLSKDLQNQFAAHEGSGSTVSHIRVGDCSKFELSLPPLAEQKAIAAVLGALDDKIELNRRMNATLEAMARALFQSWFVDFDPVRTKLDGRTSTGLDTTTAALFPSAFHETKLGHIPLGWAVGRLGDLCNLKRGHDLPASARTSGTIPVISSSGISGTHSETNVRGPGVVTGRYGTIGKVFFVDTDYWPLNTTLYVEDFKGSPPRFIFHALGEVDFSNYTDKAAVPGVNRNHLHEDPTVIPPIEVREAFAKTVTPLWSQHTANESQSRTLTTLRDTLLPKLLSGELRVSGLDSAMKAAL